MIVRKQCILRVVAYGVTCIPVTYSMFYNVVRMNWDFVSTAFRSSLERYHARYLSCVSRFLFRVHIATSKSYIMNILFLILYERMCILVQDIPQRYLCNCITSIQVNIHAYTLSARYLSCVGDYYVYIP